MEQRTGEIGSGCPTRRVASPTVICLLSAEQRADQSGVLAHRVTELLVHADGVFGCTTDAGEITIINGWNYYAGSDATQIGAAQYDFETVVTHELGHALGLGPSTHSTSVMYATLNAGSVNRSLTTADLNVPDSDTTGACGLHATVVVGRISNPSYADGRDSVFALLVTDTARNPVGGLESI